MQLRVHPLVSPASGTQRVLHSLHYGTPGQGPKVYLQASLHADELPGMLTLHHLRQHLDRADADGTLAGEVVLVPLANPIGLDQTLMHLPAGRFEHASMENFNRHYVDFFARLKDTLADRLGPDADANRRVIRAAMHEVLAAQVPRTELQSLRQVLTGLSLDADVVLDLHCDFEAVLHVYVEEPYLAAAEPLTRHLGARAVLWARGSGGNSFDEALSGPWWRLAEHYGGRFPIPLACLAATVELRGQADVDHTLARGDADRLLAYLRHLGVVRGNPGELPEALCQPTPLAGAEVLSAPHPGVLVYLRDVGDDIAAGDTVAQVVEPLAGTVTDLRASVSGRLYARHSRRWATTGLEVAHIAGTRPIRSGYLLGP